MTHERLGKLLRTTNKIVHAVQWTACLILRRWLVESMKHNGFLTANRKMTTTELCNFFFGRR